jgi:hypothetical protein
LGKKLFLKFSIDFGCCWNIVFEHDYDLLEDNMSHNHIKWCTKTMTMHYGENTSDWKTQIHQRNI